MSHCLHVPLYLASLLFALSSAVVAGAPEPDPKPEIEAGKSLLTEGDALADEGKTTEAVLRYKEAFERLLPVMRKLPFHNKVERDVTAREDLKDFLVEEIDRDMPAEELRTAELGMKALGFIPEEMDFKEVMVGVYSEEIAAFYDTRTKKMHLIDEPEAKKNKAPTFLERLLGKTGGFDKDENRSVLAHELTHALADQHFDLQTLQEAIQNDDDRSLALTALIEGEAMLTMIGAQMDDWTGEAVAVLPYEDLDRVFRFLGPLLPAFGGASLKDAPPIIRESLMFPYLRGMVFVASVTNADGWEGINAAYSQPPLSTEQILHPEKYKKAPDAPKAIDLGELDPGEGWNEVGRNVVGELQLSILLGKHDGRRAAAGWDGDRFAVFEGPEDHLGLVWRTTWDTEQDAREFAESYARFQTSKLDDDAEEPDEVPDRLRRSHDGAQYLVARRGADVVVVEGFPREATRSLQRAAFRAPAEEMTNEPPVDANEPATLEVEAN